MNIGTSIPATDRINLCIHGHNYLAQMVQKFLSEGFEELICDGLELVFMLGLVLGFVAGRYVYRLPLERLVRDQPDKIKARGPLSARAGRSLLAGRSDDA